jgi:hypothetical protein
MKGLTRLQVGERWHEGFEHSQRESKGWKIIYVRACMKGRELSRGGFRYDHGTNKTRELFSKSHQKGVSNEVMDACKHRIRHVIIGL